MSPAKSEICGIKPVLIGCASTVLSEAEQDAFRALNPFGFILFARNIENPVQLAALTASLRACTNRADTPIFVDQEGGRVARLKPPHWPELPAMGTIGSLFERNPEAAIKAMRLHAQITAQRLMAVGINGNCAPVLDIHYAGASLVMGDRTFGTRIEAIKKLGQTAVETYLAHGVYPVIKHLPGHGRVMVDPHETCPFVDVDYESLRQAEFKPFIALNKAPMGMNCHVVFRAIDPENPVSLSKKAHQNVIRGAIGFDGLLLSDDLAMGAISLPLADRATVALEAGADIVLYCTGVLSETLAFCQNLPDLSVESAKRWGRAQELLGLSSEKYADSDLLNQLQICLKT